MARTKQRMKVSNHNRRSARNEQKQRVGQLRVTPRNMPHTMFRRAWLADGSLAAIARSNDRYICGHFDANEKPLCGAVVFDGGNAERQALTWLDRQRAIDG